MLIFSTPIWLWATPAVIMAGAWLLWRGQRRAREVSSLRLWRGLTEGSAASKRRVIDPVWLMVLLAAMVAALALARPQWTGAGGGRPLPRAQLDASVRSILRAESAGGEVAQAWIRLLDGEALPSTLTINVTADGNAVSAEHSLTEAALREGAIIAVPQGAQSITLSLRAGGVEIAARQFSRLGGADGRPFGVVRAGNRPVDPAIERVISLIPGARLGDPSLGSTLVLASDPAAAGLDAMTDAALIIAGPDVKLGGIVPGEKRTARGTGGEPAFWTPVVASDAGLPSFIRFEQVQVRAMRAATLSAEWKVLARVDDRPWIALRTTPTGMVLWLASEPSADTDWPKHPSFVMFFAEIASRALARGTGERGITVNWQAAGEQAVARPEAPRASRPLGPWLGAGAMLLLVSAAGTLLWRGRRVM